MILDSGERTEYETGAVRDLKEGKGRVDLMPLEVVAEYLEDVIVKRFYDYKTSGDISFLYDALRTFIEDHYSGNDYEAMIELSKHFEDGCLKYGENNWRKGIPEKSYIDSALRHYFKIRSGRWTDENHERAFMWNTICLIWTSKQAIKPNSDWRMP